MSEIYEHLARLSPACRPRGVWGFLGPVASVRQLPRDTDRVLNGLGEAFSDLELQTAGVAVRNDHDQLAFCPEILTDPRLFLVLRTTAALTPHDLLTPCGCLHDRAPACLSAIYDEATSRSLGASKRRLLLAFDMRDVALLRRLELPVTLASGLNQLDGVGLRRLLGPPQAVSRGAISASPFPSVQRADLWNHIDKLLLVGWSVAAMGLRPRPGLQDVANLMHTAHHCFGFDTSRIVIWQPAPFEFEQLQAAVRLRDIELLRQAAAESAQRANRSIEQYVNDHAQRSPREAYRITRQRLMDELRREQERQLLSPSIGTLCDAYSRAFERGFVEPLVEEARTKTDPIDKATCLAAAELLQELHNSSLIVTGCGEYASRTRLLWQTPMEPELLKVRLTIWDRLIAILCGRSKR